MYKSVQPWCYYPVTIEKFNGRSAAGDINPMIQIEAKCYIQSEDIVIGSRIGGEYVSSTQLFFTPDVLISEDDKVVLDSKAYDIQRLSKFYDGSAQALSLQVVYL